MAIAVALAIMLFISYPIPVYAIPVAPIIGILSLAFGLFSGWVIWGWAQKEARSPGVTLDSYVSEIASAFEHDVQMFSSYGYTVMAFLDRVRLYYARLAEHRVLDYLHINESYLDQYEAEVMIDVADDFCNLTNAYFTSLSNMLDHLQWLSYDRFTGDLSQYTIYLTKDPTNFAYPYAHDLDGVAELFVFYHAKENVKVFDCNTKTIGIAEAGSNLDARKYLILAGDVDVGIAVREGASGSNDYDLHKHIIVFRDTADAQNIAVIDLKYNLEKWHVLDIVSYMDSIYDTAWAYAKVYHQMLRGLGYTKKEQVPDALLAVPPDVVFPTPWYLEETYHMTPEEVMAYYAGLLNSISKWFNESNYRVVKYLDQQNVTMPDPREWLKNVTIRFPNGTIYQYVIKLIPIWYPGNQTFYPGQDNVLQNPMGALVQLPNGEWRYIQLPSGYMINPALVHTPFGDTTNPWTLNSYPAGFNPIYQNYQSPEPEYVKTMNEVMQLIMALMPLLILLAIIQMIPRIVSGRR
ncbi:hypothetical protein DRO64_09700 [Candidatus Bathyarchaeota archaeon]|nr:MAG: hypothetical protein DRO64_09700 [Candidatus Bathyarchaeota archaeon]